LTIQSKKDEEEFDFSGMTNDNMTMSEQVPSIINNGDLLSKVNTLKQKLLLARHNPIGLKP